MTSPFNIYANFLSFFTSKTLINLLKWFKKFMCSFFVKRTIHLIVLWTTNKVRNKMGGHAFNVPIICNQMVQIQTLSLDSSRDMTIDFHIKNFMFD